MAPALLLTDTIDETKGGNTSFVPFRPVITYVESPLTETPSPYDTELLMLLESATGYLYIEDDPQYITEKAFRFMNAASEMLPYSDAADRAADALVRNVKGRIEVKTLTRRIDE